MNRSERHHAVGGHVRCRDRSRTSGRRSGTGWFSSARSSVEVVYEQNFVACGPMFWPPGRVLVDRRTARKAGGRGRSATLCAGASWGVGQRAKFRFGPMGTDAAGIRPGDPPRGNAGRAWPVPTQLRGGPLGTSHEARRPQSSRRTWPPAVGTPRSLAAMSRARQQAGGLFVERAKARHRRGWPGRED